MASSLNNSVSTRVIVDPVIVARFLTSPAGSVFRMVTEGATRVQEAAKLQVRRGHVHAGSQGLGKSSGPSLVDTIVKRVVTVTPAEIAVRVGSDKSYAIYVHEGTRPHVIVPRTASVLVFFSERAGTTVYARRVNHPGTAPNRFLTDNLPLALPGKGL